MVEPDNSQNCRDRPRCRRGGRFAGHVAQIWGNRITAEGGVALAWQDLSDDLWHHAINDTRELAVGGNGALYVSLSGGVFVLDEPDVPTADG